MSTQLRSLPSVSETKGEDAFKNQSIPSEIPKPPGTLSRREKTVWNHVTQALYEYGLIHLTDAIIIMVICRTFVRWVDAETQLDKVIADNDGTYIVSTPNGYEQPHQLFYLTRNLKKELLQWLPEAALTIPSFAKAVEARQAPTQGTLFEDPVEAHRRRKTALGMQAV